jgi:hypothetical protein
MTHLQKARIPLLLAAVWIVALALPGGHSSEVIAGDPGPVVRTIYLADPEAGLVHRVEAKFARKPRLSALEPITDIETPAALAVHPGGEFLLVLDSARGQVVKFDLERNKVVRRTRVGGDLVDIEFAPDGKHAFVADRTGEAVHVYDAKRGRVVRSIAVRGEPVGLAVTDKGTAVYTANAGTNVISRIDGQRAVVSETRLRRDAELVSHLSRRGNCTINGGLDTLRMAGADAFNYVMWTCGGEIDARMASGPGDTDFEEQTALACDSADHTGASGDDCASTDFDSEDSVSEESEESEDSVSEESEDSDSEDSEDSVSEESEESTSEDSEESEDSDSEDSDSEDDTGARQSGSREDSPPIPTVIPGRPDGHVATDLRRAITFTRKGACQADRMVVTFRPEAGADPAEGRTFLWDFQGKAREIASGVALDAMFGGAGNEVYVNGPCQGKCRPGQVARRTRTLELPGAIAITDGAMLALPQGSCESK